MSNLIECDVCGRDLTLKSGGTLIGIEIEVSCLEEVAYASYTKAMKPYELDKKYRICFPCWLKSLGIKP